MAKPDSQRQSGPVERLMAALASVPAQPIGPHLLEEDFRLLAHNELLLLDDDEEPGPEDADRQRVSTHLRSCFACARAAAAACEQAASAPAAARVLSFSEHKEAKDRAAAAALARARSRVQSRVIARTTRLSTGLDHHWSATWDDGSPVEVSLVGVAERRVLMLDTTKRSMANCLVVCRLDDFAPEGNKWPDVSLVLHDDQRNPGHVRGAAALDPRAELPLRCVPVVYEVPVRDMPVEDAIVALLDAATSSYQEEDLRAVWTWAESRGLSAALLTRLRELVRARWR